MWDKNAQETALPDAAAERLQPDTLAGRLLSTYLDVLNSGDREAMLRFSTEHFTASLLARSPGSEHARWAATVQRITGGLSLVQIVDSTDHGISVLAGGRRTGPCSVCSSR